MSVKAAEVYHNDVIARLLVKHLHKSTLRSIMSLEVEGDMFDWCVKELYRKVRYGVIYDMTRSTPRKTKYLDAVRTVDATTSALDVIGAVTSYTVALRRDDSLCSQQEISGLRLKCPNLTLITRHDVPQSEKRFTVMLTKGKTTGILRLHTARRVLSAYALDLRLLSIGTIAPWLGWDIKHTAGLRFAPGMGHTTSDRRNLLGVLEDTDNLDKHYSEISTADVEVSLSVLIDIVKSRGIRGKNAITRIASTVTPFTADELAGLIAFAGADLIELDLTTGRNASRLMPTDLPRIVILARKHCTRLRHLRLPLTCAVGGLQFTDGDIDLPPHDVPFCRGSLDTFDLYLYRCKLDGDRAGQRAALGGLFGLNAARNIACLTGANAIVTLYNGDMVIMGCITVLLAQVDLWLLDWTGLPAAIAFFRRLGPNLERHFRRPNLTHLGVTSIDELPDLRYKVDGTPLTLHQSRALDPAASRKRKWSSLYDDGSEPYDPRGDISEPYNHRDDDDYYEYCRDKPDEEDNYVL